MKNNQLVSVPFRGNWGFLLFLLGSLVSLVSDLFPPPREVTGGLTKNYVLMIANDLFPYPSEVNGGSYIRKM